MNMYKYCTTVMCIFLHDSSRASFLEHDRFAVFSSKFGVQTPDFI